METNEKTQKLIAALEKTTGKKVSLQDNTIKEEGSEESIPNPVKDSNGKEYDVNRYKKPVKIKRADAEVIEAECLTTAIKLKKKILPLLSKKAKEIGNRHNWTPDTVELILTGQLKKNL